MFCLGILILIVVNSFVIILFIETIHHALQEQIKLPINLLSQIQNKVHATICECFRANFFLQYRVSLGLCPGLTLGLSLRSDLSVRFSFRIRFSIKIKYRNGIGFYIMFSYYVHQLSATQYWSSILHRIQQLLSYGVFHTYVPNNVWCKISVLWNRSSFILTKKC